MHKHSAPTREAPHSSYSSSDPFFFGFDSPTSTSSSSSSSSPSSSSSSRKSSSAFAFVPFCFLLPPEVLPFAFRFLIAPSPASSPSMGSATPSTISVQKSRVDVVLMALFLCTRVVSERNKTVPIRKERLTVHKR